MHDMNLDVIAHEISIYFISFHASKAKDLHFVIMEGDRSKQKRGKAKGGSQYAEVIPKRSNTIEVLLKMVNLPEAPFMWCRADVLFVQEFFLAIAMERGIIR